ncbi:heme/hemin ABC transporter substrate-binding protein [Paragemmobacter ruber]|uniref:ABC transporter substrate-binding protein n=1 Tax=Paragemmobacter ruber TaxID=1985673 RepID=A0ABW9Y3I9_9RHOB|nr:ABC transporter substrate-binding protein [Rhodobacter ruber]NBE06440.1 ABC transporter substrate-binding protein [Rhodobacter ruber]
MIRLLAPRTLALSLALAQSLTLSLATSAPAMADPAQRVLTLGGSVTEIAVALGAQDRLIGRDTTSTFPPEVTGLPDVGYFRALSPEGVLALNPDLILSETGAGPQEALDVLNAAGIPFIVAGADTTPEGLTAKIETVAQALDLPAEGKALADKVAQGLQQARDRAATVQEPKRVLFILSLQGGRVMAGGEGSSAESIITLAGGINAGSGFEGYKQITDEAVLTAAPDVILMMDREGDLAINNDMVMAHPALSQTPAAKAGRILRMDGLLLLGFGPRTPQAAVDLHALLYPGQG